MEEGIYFTVKRGKNMKLFVNQLYTVALLSLGVTIWGMQDQRLVSSNFSSILEQMKFDQYKDQRSHIFKWLDSKDTNALRKTCKKFSTILSFCNPSFEFIACNNNIHENDMKSLFFTALYDGDYAIARCFRHEKKINQSYKIKGISYALYPSDLIRMHENSENYLLLKDLKETTSDKVLPHCMVNALLIACISRNSERVEKVLTNDYEIVLNDAAIQQSFHTVINNNDTQTISILCNNQILRSYVQENGGRLIRQAISCGSKKSCEALIKSNLCNINQRIAILDAFYEEPDDTLVVCTEEFTLLDYLYHENSSLEIFFGKSFIIDIEKLLISNGAKTVDDSLSKEL